MPVKKPNYSYTDLPDAGDILKEITFMPSTAENIDQAIFKFINEELDLFATTNKGRKKVPVIWVSAERAHQIKNNRDLRDNNGVLKLPLITVERTALTKDPAFKGTWQAHMPDSGRTYHKVRRVNIPAARRINQNKTSNFANAFSSRKSGQNQQAGIGQQNFPARPNRKNPTVLETVYLPIPIWVNATYSLKLRTQYIQQMNDLTQPFYTFTGQMNSFFATNEGHRYEGFVEGDFGKTNNIADMGEEERTYITEVNLKVLGYLMGEGSNDKKPKITVTQNFVDVKIPRERVIVGDINEFLREDEEGKGFYRE